MLKILGVSTRLLGTNFTRWLHFGDWHTSLSLCPCPVREFAVPHPGLQKLN